MDTVERNTSGFDADRDVRMNVGSIFRGADHGTFSHIIQVGDKSGQSEAIVLHIERMASVEGLIVLEVIYSYNRVGDAGLSAVTKTFPIKLPPPYCNLRVTSREMRVLLRLLNKNRDLLNQKYVKRTEKLHQPWLVSLLTPFQPYATTATNATRERSVLKKGLACAVCGRSDDCKLSCCSVCQQTFYCSREHQRLDWPRHKKECGGNQPSASPSLQKRGELRSGDTVIVHGLSKAIDLNGCRGTLFEFNEEGGRWTVLLDSTKKPKLVLVSNLRQDVGVALPQNKQLPLPKMVSYEDEQLWAGASSCLIPQVAATTASALASGEVQLFIVNGQTVEINKVRTNVHGKKVFVIKLQHTLSRLVAGSRPPSNMMIYDQLRNIFLDVTEDEKGGRGNAFKELAAIAQERGGACGAVMGTSKIFLFAQRAGASLRIFTKRLPCQAQSF